MTTARMLPRSSVYMSEILKSRLLCISWNRHLNSFKHNIYWGILGNKKTKKLIIPRKLEKKKTELWKKPIKSIRILKKPTGSVRFRFINLKPKKLNRTGKKTKKNDSSRFLFLNNQTETGKFEPI